MCQLPQLWQEHQDGESFVGAAQKNGYQVAQGNDRRPFRVVNPDGQGLDLVRQLDDIKTKAVRDRLQPILDNLPTETEALKQIKIDCQPILEQSDKPRELSDIQDRAEALKSHYREAINDNKNTAFPDNRRRKFIPINHAKSPRVRTLPLKC